jgi:putative transcriptional regulator
VTENVFTYLLGTAGEKPYHYTECGLDDVWLRGGFEEVTTEHGTGVAIMHDEELHNAIGRHLATSKKVLSGKELRFLRKEMDLTQAALGKMVGLSDQQVARWEKGQCNIPSAADHLLRVLYLEHIGGNLKVRELLTLLKETDSDRSEGRQEFTLDDGTWVPKMAA